MQKSAKSIAERNDYLRTNLAIGQMKVLLTRSVAESENRNAIVSAVREFKTFKKDNDPHGEHDFGSFIVAGTKYFFKFDYYDDSYKYFQEDGNRVLTIMQADEY